MNPETITAIINGLPTFREKLIEILESLGRIHTDSFEDGVRKNNEDKADQILSLISESLPEIERAHTYASENADIYRAFDEGQIDYRDRIKNNLGI